MSNAEAPKIKYMVLITERRQKDRLLTALSDKGCHVINIFYGKGAVKEGYLLDTFGLVSEENKVLISCLLSCREADAIMAMLETEFRFGEPNTGIAYTVPVEQLVY